MTDRRNDNAPEYPKPYDFVAIPKDKIRTSERYGHHIYKQESLSGKIEGFIIARSPVHVASGLVEPREGDYPLVKACVRSNNKPIIPGSSLKGCIRSITEALTHSYLSVVGRDSRDFSELQLPRIRSREKPDKVDHASQLFGTLNYQGLVYFHDAVLLEGQTTVVPSVQLFRPRAEARPIYRDGNRPRGRKFYQHGKLAKGNLPLEACPADSKFALRVTFENLKPADLGLLLTALGQGSTKFWPKLGGHKPACLGTIEFQELQIRAIDRAASYSSFDLEYYELDKAELVNAAQSHMHSNQPFILPAQLGQLVEILHWPNDRQCPDGVY
jgi:CRISPR/Cas system CSM-associated protein Csm3 (group 7 of RAMP superfamily)